MNVRDCILARRYANYKGGKKYDGENGEALKRGTGEAIKAESANVFYPIWKQAEAEPRYKAMKADWKATIG